MDFVLKLKHWQAFIILMVGLFLSNFEIGNNSTLTTVLMLTGMAIYFLWILFAGHCLFQLLPEKIELNYTLFMINSFIWFAIYFGAMVFSDSEGMTFYGFTAILFLYVFYAFIYFIMFPARTLKSIELGRKAEISECIGDFFLILFFPIGIWFLQPRINKLVEKQNDIL